MSCAVCGEPGPARKLWKQQVEIMECTRCGLAWWEPPADFEPEAVYDAAYFADAQARHGYDDYASLEDSLRRNFARRLARLPAPRSERRLLDVGAAYGFAVDEAVRAGFRAVGIEVSVPAAVKARDVTHGRVALASMLAPPFADETFDIVTMWDAIEHLADPHAAVSDVARLLRPGGCFVLTTGDVGSLLARISGPHWHLYTIPEHLFFYTRKSLSLLLEAHGFEVESIRAEGALYTVGYLVERLRKTLLGLSRTGPSRWPGSGLCVPVNLFDLVTVTARRAPQSG